MWNKLALSTFGKSVLLLLLGLALLSCCSDKRGKAITTEFSREPVRIKKPMLLFLNHSCQERRLWRLDVCKEDRVDYHRANVECMMRSKHACKNPVGLAGRAERSLDRWHKFEVHHLGFSQLVAYQWEEKLGFDCPVGNQAWMLQRMCFERGKYQNWTEFGCRKHCLNSFANELTDESLNLNVAAYEFD